MIIRIGRLISVTSLGVLAWLGVVLPAVGQEVVDAIPGIMVGPVLRVEREEPPPEESPDSGPVHVTVVGASNTARQNEERIRSALDRQTEAAFFETSLEDVATYLEGEHDIPIVIDQQALSELGLDTEIPITLELRHVTLQAYLEVMLQPLGLTYEIRNEVLRITSQDRARATFDTRIYGGEQFLGYTQDDFAALVELIQENVSPQSWDTADGQASISVQLKDDIGVLVITQNQWSQARIEDLLGSIYEMREQMKETQAAP